MLISVEGPNYSGKTLVTKKIKQLLEQKHSVFCTKEPIVNDFGRIIRNNTYNLSPLAYHYLILAQRAEHNIIIKKRFSDYEIVISDRYICSNLVYQSMKGLIIDEIHEMNRGFLQPDITICLNSSIDSLKERRESRDNISYFESITSLSEEHQTYVDIFKYLESKRKNIYVLDTTNNDFDAQLKKVLQNHFRL